MDEWFEFIEHGETGLCACCGIEGKRQPGCQECVREDTP